jgi:hypothetical protein
MVQFIGLEIGIPDVMEITWNISTEKTTDVLFSIASKTSTMSTKTPIAKRPL